MAVSNCQTVTKSLFIIDVISLYTNSVSWAMWKQEVDYFPVIAYHIMFYCSYTTSVCQHLQ